MNLAHGIRYNLGLRHNCLVDAQEVAFADQADGQVGLTGGNIRLEKVRANVAAINERPRGLGVLEVLGHHQSDLTAASLPAPL